MRELDELTYTTGHPGAVQVRARYQNLAQTHDHPGDPQDQVGHRVQAQSHQTLSRHRRLNHQEPQAERAEWEPTSNRPSQDNSSIHPDKPFNGDPEQASGPEARQARPRSSRAQARS